MLKTSCMSQYSGGTRDNSAGSRGLGGVNGGSTKRQVAWQVGPHSSMRPVTQSVGIMTFKPWMSQDHWELRRADQVKFDLLTMVPRPEPHVVIWVTLPFPSARPSRAVMVSGRSRVTRGILSFRARVPSIKLPAAPESTRAWQVCWYLPHEMVVGTSTAWSGDWEEKVAPVTTLPWLDELGLFPRVRDRTIDGGQSRRSTCSAPPAFAGPSLLQTVVLPPTA